VLSAADVKAIAATGEARWLLALDGGLRQGEALGLGRESVDLDAATASVDWQLQRIAYAHGCGPQAGKRWPVQEGPRRIVPGPPPAHPE